MHRLQRQRRRLRRLQFRLQHGLTPRRLSSGNWAAGLGSGWRVVSNHDAVYATLERLEAKGYVSSFTGEPTAERGGRAKRHFEIEAAGHQALNASQNALKNMSEGLSRRWKRA